VTTDVVSGARRWSVALRRDADDWVAGVHGREVRLDVCRVGGRWSLLVREAGSPGGPGRSYDVAIERQPGGRRVVHVDGRVFPCSLAEPRISRRRPGSAVAPGPAGAWRLVVPMPGRVVRVFVGPGDAVAPGQGLVVVEAMKMENELRAPRAGIVAEVRVREGMAVEANAVLLVLE
jgi:acetyl/propionyl-CoA carboxylase alpha subunit